ncbi:MAG: NOL1/NOP2/sun family putative RNA methylase [Candidatus Nanoarchaeia archaeon]
MKQRKIPTPKPLFLERMKEVFQNEKDYKSYLKILKTEPPKSIRCNVLKISPNKLKKRLELYGWKLKTPFKDYPEVMIIEGKIVNPNSEKNILTQQQKTSNLSVMDNKKGGRLGSRGGQEKIIPLEPGELGRALEHIMGYYYIQELASMLPVIALKPMENEIILDLCSAPGSKTTQIAASMNNTGTIIANEVSLGRIKILASNLERCGMTNTIITKKDGVALCKRLKKQDMQFDKILVDAPCSGEGTLRTSHKTYAMWNIKTVKNLPKIQTSLVETALEILKPKGILVYSTCTHSPEENEGVVNAILNKFNNIKIETIKLPIKCRQGLTCWEDNNYDNEIKKSCRIYPQDNNTEGFFITKIRKLR